MTSFGKDVEKLELSFIVGSILKFFKSEIENKHMYKWTKVKNDCKVLVRNYADHKEWNIKGRQIDDR